MNFKLSSVLNQKFVFTQKLTDFISYWGFLANNPTLESEILHLNQPSQTITCKIGQKSKRKQSKSEIKCTNIFHLDVSAANHNAIHLFEGELGGLRHLVFDEGEALVLVSNRIPWQIDTFDRAKWKKGLFDRVFFDFKVYTANIDPAKRDTQENKSKLVNIIIIINSSYKSICIMWYKPL